MGKMKGGAGLNYQSIIAQLKMMLSKPHSNNYKHDFSSQQYISSDTLAQLANGKIHIGTIMQEGEWDSFASVVPQHFNSVTAANDMKWGHMCTNIGEYDFSVADKMVDYAIANKCRVRGHTLLWGRVPGKSYPCQLDSIVANSLDPKGQLQSILEEHIERVVGHFRGRVHSWDVVNEPMQVFGSNIADYMFYNVLGEDYIANAFVKAHQVDPEACLTLNEQFFFYKDKRAKRFLQLVEYMVSKGVPIHCVGLQHHAMFAEQNLDDLRWFASQLESMGVAFELTEVDIRQGIFKKSANMALAQAESYYNLVSTCLQCSNFRGITLWGISDDKSWLNTLSPFNTKQFQPNNALLFDNCGYKKPAYYGVLQALVDNL